MLTPSEKTTLHNLMDRVSKYKHFNNNQEAYNALKKLLDKLCREFTRLFFLYRIKGDECELIHRNVDIMKIVAETADEILIMKQCEIVDYIIRRIHTMEDREFEAAEIISNFLQSADDQIYSVMRNITGVPMKNLLEKFNDGADIITHQVHNYIGILKILVVHSGDGETSCNENDGSYHIQWNQVSDYGNGSCGSIATDSEVIATLNDSFDNDLPGSTYQENEDDFDEWDGPDVATDAEVRTIIDKGGKFTLMRQ